MTTTTQPYDTSYEPAAPVISIGLSPSGSATPRQHLTALIDSGADASMFPTATLLAAGARVVEQRQMRGLIGNAITVNLYLTAVHIGTHPNGHPIHTIHGIRAIGIPTTDEPIIGRDVLNQLETLLNGPAHETTILP
ncbi:MAG: hypothetical protein R3C62_08680 [Chloroflexota bacterium]